MNTAEFQTSSTGQLTPSPINTRYADDYADDETSQARAQTRQPKVLGEKFNQQERLGY